MSLQKFNIRNSVLILMIIAAAVTRSLNINHISEWVTFTPIGAVALFAGTYFKDKVKAFVVPLLVVFISDLALNYAWLHKFVWFSSSSVIVYISLAVMVVMGMYIKKVNVVNVTGMALGAVLMHWLLTDMPFLYTLYPHNLTGYGQALVAAIPFEKSLLFGNLIFGALLYGGFELAKRKYTVLQINTELAV